MSNIARIIQYSDSMILNALDLKSPYEDYTAQVNEMIGNKIVKSLNKVSVSEDTIFLMDENSTSIHKERILGINAEFSFADYEISIPLSIASVLTFVTQKRWVDDHEKMIGYELNYKNTNNIMKSPYKEKILKLKYFKSE